MADYEALQVGQIFAERYRVEKFLAKGGFGAVYVAEQIETELKVALKVLWPHVLHSETAVEKFRLEARVAGRVNSEHIVKVFDAGFDRGSGMPFLVMELLHGAELDKVVETEGPLEPARVAHYFRQIASGLDKAHGYVTREGARNPIVHRDLKPENIFLAKRETGEALIKILDFGIAKVLTESTNVSQEVKGTPLYMAFEQVAAGKITPQTDIWPLGLITFYLLTGKAYWKAANHGESTITMLFGEVLSLPIEAASVRARELGVAHLLPAAFDAWFARCVDRDATRRFASAGECSEALAAALGTPLSRLGTQPSELLQTMSDSGSAPAQSTPGLGRTTSTPFVSGEGLPRKKGSSLKWLLLGGVALAAAAVTAQQALKSSVPVASESVTAAAPPTPSLATPSVEPPPPVPSATLIASVAAAAAAAPPAAAPSASAPNAAVPHLGSRPSKPSAATPPPAAAAAPAAAPPATKPTAAKPDPYGER